MNMCRLWLRDINLFTTAHSFMLSTCNMCCFCLCCRGREREREREAFRRRHRDRERSNFSSVLCPAVRRLMLSGVDTRLSLFVAARVGKLTSSSLVGPEKKRSGNWNKNSLKSRIRRTEAIAKEKNDESNDITAASL